MVPINNVAQQIGKERGGEQELNAPKKRDECPNCRTKRPVIQLACKRCKLCIECMNHTVCKSTEPDYIENLPRRFKAWVLTPDQTQIKVTTKKKQNHKPTDIRRHIEHLQTNESHNPHHAKRRRNRKKINIDQIREMRALVKECKNKQISAS